MYIITHSRDLDGHCSGAILKQRFPEAKVIGFDYGQPLPELQQGRAIIMADVSVPIKDMEYLSILSGHNFTWLDHHASAIKEFNEHSSPDLNAIHTVLQNGISACELTWKYCFPDKPLPRAVELIGKYDVWRRDTQKEWDEEILPFQYGMRSICNSPETFPTYVFDNVAGRDQDIVDIIGKGKTILKYQNQVNEVQCKKAFEHEIQGYRAICLNLQGFGSNTFDSVYDENKHDLMCCFQWSGEINKWVVSFYTTKGNVDCSVIAKSFGGGGHVKASGCQLNSITELFPNIK